MGLNNPRFPALAYLVVIIWLLILTYWFGRIARRVVQLDTWTVDAGGNVTSGPNSPIIPDNHGTVDIH